MEVDMSKQIPNRSEMWLVESKALVEDLACEGPIVFEDESVTFHREN